LLSKHLKYKILTSRVMFSPSFHPLSALTLLLFIIGFYPHRSQWGGERELKPTRKPTLMKRGQSQQWRGAKADDNKGPKLTRSRGRSQQQRGAEANNKEGLKPTTTTSPSPCWLWLSSFSSSASTPAPRRHQLPPLLLIGISFHPSFSLSASTPLLLLVGFGLVADMG
jgi:hypothetical protein